MSLLVEDGTGLAAAESYLSVADADSYHTLYGSTGWNGTSDEKEVALRVATQYLNAQYGQRWVGSRINSTMALHWPRHYIVDRDGYALAADAVPTQIKNATAYMALRSIQGDTLMPDTAAAGNITSESKGIGQLSKSVTYAGVKSSTKHYSIVESMLGDLITSAGTVSRG